MPVPFNRDRIAPWLRYGVAVLSVGVAVAVGRFAKEWASDVPALLMPLAVAISAFVGGIGPGLLATALTAFSGSYFFLVPRHAFQISDPVDQWRLAAFLTVGSIISFLSEALHRSRRRIQASETSLQRIAREAREAQGAADAANRAKDQFIAVLSHELRTPLTPAFLTVQMLEKRTELTEELRASLSAVRRNLELEARLIDDLLDLTRIAQGKLQLNPEVTDLHANIQHVLDICDNDIQAKQLQVAVETSAQHRHLMADPARLQQVLWNLVRNAIKFTPAGGRIAIRTVDVEGGRIQVSVSDTGIGIEPEVVPRLFVPFEQGDREVGRIFGGLGLGLSISKALVDLHQGTLRAASEGRDKGATFTLELPTTTRRPAPTRPAAAPPAVEPVRGIRQVLLVEDHADTARIMKQLLETFGYAVKTANSLAAALKAVEDQRFDLLVSDIGLPDGSGLDLMQRVRQLQPLKAIAVSGYGQLEDVRRSKEAGFDEHLTKPINVAQFEAVLRRLLGNGNDGIHPA